MVEVYAHKDHLLFHFISHLARYECIMALSYSSLSAPLNKSSRGDDARVQSLRATLEHSTRGLVRGMGVPWLP